ncbi:MAG TPA: hypothetical protein VF575_02915 [Candidatus Saccharimonadales bacterium]|jgi:hypothetical protein
MAVLPASSSSSPSSSREIKKDTVYIDVDDEITSIVEKLQNSPQRIVALVLPKRAAVLQSVVNMKLLKRSADNAKKHVVLITSESGLLPLAGVVGLHVASSLQSKPAIPVVPASLGGDMAMNNGDDMVSDVEDFSADAAADKPIGVLAGLPPEEPETIQMNDDEDSAKLGASAAAVSGSAAATAAVKGKNKKLKIPNFNKFRTLLIAGVAVFVLLIGGFIYGNIALAKATITLKTNSSDVLTKASLTLDPSVKEVDLETDTLPARIETKQQTGSQQVSTSGEKNNGTKATGEVTLTLLNCDVDSVTVPAGTGVSSGGQTFITQSSATMESVKIAGKCRNTDFKDVSTAGVSVVAQKAGAGYNLPPSPFTVAGYSNVSGGSSDPMSGGTDNIVKVVAQADIDSAKQKIAGQEKDSNTAEDDLAKKLSAAGYTAIAASLKAGEPTVTPSAAVGDQADTVTVSQSTTYTMYGAKSADIKKIIAAHVREQIDTSKQEILKDGFDTAKYEINTPNTAGPLGVTLSATSLAGPDIKTDRLASQLAGKKTGDVKSVAKSIPGVSDATVKYSPFWISSVPKNASKVEIIIEKSAQPARTTNGSNQ